MSVCYPPLHLFALTTCFIIVCGETATYQRTACDGFYHCIEDVDRKTQQCRSTVNYSFIHVVLKEREKELSAVGFLPVQQAPMEGLEQTEKKKKYKEVLSGVGNKQITFLCRTATENLFHFRVLTLTQEHNAHLYMVMCGRDNQGSIAEFEVYLSAVQVKILVANLQLQNLHLVVPLLYYRGVPH